MFLLFLVLATFIETLITTIPFVLMVLLFATIFSEEKKVYFLAVIFGVILDMLFLRTIGVSSLYFLIFIFLVKAYSSKYETKTFPFIFLSSFFGSMFYLVILQDSYFLIESFIISLIALLFSILSVFTKKKFLVNKF